MTAKSDNVFLQLIEAHDEEKAKKNDEKFDRNLTKIRVKLPDGLFIQGTFDIRERVQKVKDFIKENLTQSDR